VFFLPFWSWTLPGLIIWVKERMKTKDTVTCGTKGSFNTSLGNNFKYLKLPCWKNKNVPEYCKTCLFPFTKPFLKISTFLQIIHLISVLGAKQHWFWQSFATLHNQSKKNNPVPLIQTILCEKMWQSCQILRILKIIFNPLNRHIWTLDSSISQKCWQGS
jgi:hypothetical protein